VVATRSSPRSMSYAATSVPEVVSHAEPDDDNRIARRGAAVYTDFEAACRGPLEWDLAYFERETVQCTRWRSVVTVRRVVLRARGLYALFAVIGRLAEQTGAVACGRAPGCWCERPLPSTFRWVSLRARVRTRRTVGRC
jgi:hypothetical protein